MALIELRDVTKSYTRDADEISVLDRVSITVDEGDFLGLMGPSGSGKSTLLNLLAGIDRPTRGSIRIGGTEVSSLSERALAGWRARHIGFIFQLYNLIPVLTAFENVELPLLLTTLSKKQRRDHVLTALGIVGLTDREAHYPRQLSGGQEQRVAIARAIVTDPTLLLADEPTGDLDAKSAAEVLTLLQRLNGEYKKTIVMVTHDPHAAERATHLLHLEKGLLVEQARVTTAGGWSASLSGERSADEEYAMKFIGLVFKSARRSKRRTALTILSVALAVFLFSALRAVLQGFDAVSAASSAQRLVTIRSTSMIFSMPTSHGEAIRSTPGVQDITWANWFGGIYKDPKNFFGQFAIDPESYLRMYPEVLLSADDKQAFLADRTGCIVGDGLAKKYGWSIGDRIVLQPGIPTYGTQDYPFTIRGIYRAGSSAVDNQSMMFHWKYADERSIVKGEVGWYVTRVADPDRAVQVANTIDQKFANSPYETKTDTEQAFSAQFASMLGNLNVLLGSVALAVVLTTLFVAGNTMAMSVRERTTEIAVMRTLGFPAATIFMLVVGEGVLVAVVGGVLGGALARLLVNAEALGLAGGFIPAFGVSNSNVGVGLGLSLVIGLLAAVIPAAMASRLKIVDALRRVA